MSKIKGMRGKAGAKAKLLFMGQKPSITHGSDLVALSAKDVHRLGVMGAKSLGIWSPGASIDLIWATSPFQGSHLARR
jgi:hypothetical protein